MNEIKKYINIFYQPYPFRHWISDIEKYFGPAVVELTHITLPSPDLDNNPFNSCI